MKIKTNKAKQAKSTKPQVEAPSRKPEKPRYSVEQITNGFIVEKSWHDENYNYKCEKTYYEKNPIDL